MTSPTTQTIMDIYNRNWITENAIKVIAEYAGGLTLRALHYRLVALGMTNTISHYKRVIGAMTKARKEYQIPFDAFVDHERDTLGMTTSDPTDVDDKISEAETQIGAWMNEYSKNRWENQPIYPEVFIEKKALQGVFEQPCASKRVALSPCKGYPSLTFLHDASVRFRNAIDNGKEPVILYFGDYDASGEDIPRSIEDNMRDIMGVDVEVRRCALMEDQVIEWGLPPAPTKSTDTRAVNWDGLGQVELDAVEPRKLQRMVTDAINDVFDQDLHDELMEQQDEEKTQYVADLKLFVQSL